MTERLVFELILGKLTLEGGASMPFRRVRGWAWGPDGTTEHLENAGATIIASGEDIDDQETVVSGRSDQPTPTGRLPAPAPWPVVSIVHALTGDMRAGGPGGWWAPVIGPGEPLDPTRHLLVCFNNLGGCYGSSGPADIEFPRRSSDPTPEPPLPPRGGFARDGSLPATLTSWDQARTHLDALDAIGAGRVDLLVGGSVGGSQALCMALLDPPRFARLVPFAANVAASPWIIAWNHVARQALLATGGTRGLALARQIAHATYRAPQGLQQRQGRTMFTGDPHRTWSSKAPYDVQTYLEHQGRKLTERYTPGAYLCALDAMDHHDARRPPPGHRGSWTLDRVEAAALVVTINSDCLFTHDDGDALAGALLAERHVIDSPHGHDAFLIEWEQVRSALTRAWELEVRTPTR